MAKKKKKRNPFKLLQSYFVLQAANREASKRITHICPIYRPNTVLEPELIGTGVFLAIGNKRFVLTAAHVFGPAGEGHQMLYIPSHTSGNLTELAGTYLRSMPNDDVKRGDSSDVGIVLLDDTLTEQITPESFISLSMVDVDDVGNLRRPYLVMGFPWRVSPKVCRRTRIATAKAFSYATELFNNEHLQNLGLSPASHFFLRYAKRHSRNQHGQDLTAPDPHGLSGGPVWRMEPADVQGETSKLAGIIIEWHRNEGGILAFRLPLVLAGIGQICPEIAHLIPQARTVNIVITSPPLAPENTEEIH